MPSTTSSRGSDPATADVGPGPQPQEPAEALCQRLRYRFADPGLLELALRHRSWCAEHDGAPSNERLEFLGDAVLGLVVTDHLFRTAPTTSEGVLARRRSELVSATALASVARTVGLGDALRLGKGEEATGGRNKTSILADAMEGVLGAVYLDGGMGAAASVVLRLLDERITGVVAGDVASDHKSRLQELAAQLFGELPRYELTETGPEHAKEFSAVVRLGGSKYGQGAGRTKKEAEQAAARQAWERLQADSATASDDVVPPPIDEETAATAAGGDHAGTT